MKKYLVYRDGKYSIEKRSQAPSEYLKVIGDEVSESDLRFLSHEVTVEVDPITELDKSVVTVSVDEDLKASTMASEQAAQEKADKISKKVKRLRFAEEVKAEIAILNDEKGWDSATFMAYMADSSVQQVSLLLGDGALDSAVSVLIASDLSSYYSSEEKQNIVDMINNYISNEV